MTGTVSVVVSAGGRLRYGHGTRPWDAVVDALTVGETGPGAVTIDWDAGECDKWDCTSGHVYAGPRMERRIGRWERIHPGETG